MRQAYATRDAARAKKLLENIARSIRSNHPDAAASLCEGLDETLTIMRFGLPLRLERMLSTTNAIENLIGSARQRTARVKRWKNGSMILRWTVASVHDASNTFRRVWAHDHFPKLIAALDRNDKPSMRIKRKPRNQTLGTVPHFQHAAGRPPSKRSPWIDLRGTRETA